MTEQRWPTEQLFELQRRLIDDYWRIEGLPKPPLALQTKAGQRIARELAYRIMEELYEFKDEALPDERCAELCDALHFYIELLIYAGVPANSLDLARAQHWQGGNTTVEVLVDVLKAGRFLRYKPWKQRPVSSDIVSYRQTLLKIGIGIFNLARYEGYSDETLFNAFLGTFKKNVGRIDGGQY